VNDYHKSYPIRLGIPREELKSKLKLETRTFNAIIKKLVSSSEFKVINERIAIQEHEIQFDQDQQEKIKELIGRFSQNPYTPPSVKESVAAVGVT